MGRQRLPHVIEERPDGVSKAVDPGFRELRLADQDEQNQPRDRQEKEQQKPGRSGEPPLERNHDKRTNPDRPVCDRVSGREIERRQGHCRSTLPDRARRVNNDRTAAAWLDRS